MELLRRFTTAGLLYVMTVAVTPAREMSAFAQSLVTKGTTTSPPEVVQLSHTTCARFVTGDRWIPVKNNARSGKLTPLAPLIRRKSRQLKSSGRNKEARRLKWKLAKLEGTCRTITNPSQDMTNDYQTATPSQDVSPPTPPTPQPTSSPTPSPQSTTPPLPTPLPDVAVPPAPAGGFSFALIDACSDRAVLALPTEWSVQRNQLPLSYTIKVNAGASIRSVRFSYRGVSRLDNTLPFSLFGETGAAGATDYLPGELPSGRTMIEVTGYLLPDGSGLPAASGLLALTVQPNPINPITLDLNQITALDLPSRIASIDNFRVSPSGCLSVDGSDPDGGSVAFELTDETQTWKAVTPPPVTDDSAALPDGYQKIAASNTRILLTYQREPYECGWDGLSTLINGIQTNLASPFQGCVSIERGSDIAGTDNFILLGTSYIYSEDSDPVASLHLARVQGNGKAYWKTRLPFTLQTSINVQNIAYIAESSADSLTSKGMIGILLSIGDDSSGPLPPAPLQPGTNIVFADANSGVVLNNQVFPGNEEPLRITGLGYDAYGILSIKPNGNSQSSVVRIVR